MADFDKKILEMERELSELKTDGRKSSSSLALTSRTVTITQQLVGYTYNYHNDSCAAKYSAVIEIIPTDGKIPFISYGVASNSNELVRRYVEIFPTTRNGHNAIRFYIRDGSQADHAIVENDGTIPAINFDIEIFCTSFFTTNITYDQEH